MFRIYRNRLNVWLKSYITKKIKKLAECHDKYLVYDLHKQKYIGRKKK